ncbi:uncharacterized protein LOC107024910 [Solanum pennellii]|uniref:Uncharacterized protein LOC107024910 n=1 Tax=Solanum pennellii TaxID=28526 RepID=A0ABM1H767_SOLPN|nr:uncharacterized protein LOC107024910 [Solanum pennellii]
MKKLKMDWNEAAEQRLNGLNDLDEFRLKTYENSAIYKEKMKKKLKSKWTGSFLITKVLTLGAVELESKEGARFTVNGQRIKFYLGHAENANEVAEAYRLDEV